jgi:hypothetical protein
MDLRIPADFERLPEFRMLVAQLGERRAKAGNPKELDQAATYIWMRLWVELAYLAQTTNRPGWINPQGAALFESSLEPLFGEDCQPLALLESSGSLKKQGADYLCERFAKLNAHLAGNYTPREIRGAAASALERNKERIQKEADQQGMLLSPEIFRRRDGSPLSAVEIKRAMVVIKTVDNCLKVSGRKTGEYTAGLIADADYAASKHGAALYSFYVWLSTNRENPMLPNTAEQILAEFERFLEMSKG